MGRKTDVLVGLIDILPTVCGSVGIPVSPHVQGNDLNAFFGDGKDSVEERFLFCESLMPTKFELGPFFGLVSDRWKYIYTSQPELYNLRKDPHETKNLLHQHPQQARIMEDRLRLVLQNSGHTGTGDTKVKVDEESARRLESLGYVSSRPVKESVKFGRIGSDPKEFIEVYNFIEKFLLLASNKKYDEAKKLANEMLTERPDMKQAHYYLGLIAFFQEDTQAMKRHFTRYLELAESESDNFNIRAKSEYELAHAYAHLGDVFKHESQIDQAIMHYKEALSHDPYMVTTYYNLAGVHLLQGSLSDAVACYMRILDLDGDATDALNNLAWILSTAEDTKIYNPADALKFALRACELTKYNNPNFLDTLAVAYAATGRLAEAIKCAKKAVDLATLSNQLQLAEEIKGRLEFYKNGRAYRDSAK
jgi:tetratricopeptide (TPR) repeat protein